MALVPLLKSPSSISHAERVKLWAKHGVSGNDTEAVRFAGQFPETTRDTLAEYRQAIAAAESACAEFLTDELPKPDGSLTYRNALVAERAAMKAYTTAVRDLASILSERQPSNDCRRKR
jgi:hypothetical protein